jgi:hypothetical protein
MTETNGFKQHCIVELFGHQVIAGLVSEQQIGGTSFVRVDVPETKARPAFTKFFGSNAIYAITPVDEATAKQAAEVGQAPVNEWRFKTVEPSRQLGFGENLDDDIDDDECPY